MIVSLIMIVHALVYSNKYTLLIVIFGYILIIVSTVIYGIYKPLSKPKFANLSETNLSLINPGNTYSRGIGASIIDNIINDNIFLRSPLRIQTYEQLLLDKPIDVDKIDYLASYMTPEEREDYTAKTVVESLKANILAGKGDYKEDYDSMYQ